MDGKEGVKSVSDVLQRADIALDGYEDIFSDFDPSPYSKRLLSDDFLSELHRRYSVTGKGKLEVLFTLPKADRDEKTEALIKKRIKDYFRGRVKDVERRARDKTRAGIVRIAAGIIFSLAFFAFPELEAAPAATILSVLIWYSMWTGFESLSEASIRLNRRRAFAERFLKAEYEFVAEEDVLESMQKMQVEAQAPPVAPPAPKK